VRRRTPPSSSYNMRSKLRAAALETEKKQVEGKSPLSLFAS
jgi:hypothetical protein